MVGLTIPKYLSKAKGLEAQTPLLTYCCLMFFNLDTSVLAAEDDEATKDTAKDVMKDTAEDNDNQPTKDVAKDNDKSVNNESKDYKDNEFFMVSTEESVATEEGARHRMATLVSSQAKKQPRLDVIIEHEDEAPEVLSNHATTPKPSKIYISKQTPDNSMAADDWSFSSYQIGISDAQSTQLCEANSKLETDLDTAK